MTTYEERRAFGDENIQIVTSIISKAKGWNAADIVIASDLQDMREATDLIHQPTGARISLRCRQMKFIRYFGQFTVRTSGAVSEWEKLQASEGYLMFYCFQDAGIIRHWWLIDLTPTAFKWMQGEEGGDDSAFMAFTIVPETVLKSSEPEPSGLFYRRPPEAA